MTDTVKRLLDYAEGYARAHTYGTSNDRQALEAELRTLFMPISYDAVITGYCLQPHKVQYVSVFMAGVRWAEREHGCLIQSKEDEHSPT